MPRKFSSSTEVSISCCINHLLAGLLEFCEERFCPSAVKQLLRRVTFLHQAILLSISRGRAHKLTQIRSDGTLMQWRKGASVISLKAFSVFRRSVLIQDDPFKSLTSGEAHDKTFWAFSIHQAGRSVFTPSVQSSRRNHQNHRPALPSQDMTKD